MKRLLIVNSLAIVTQFWSGRSMKGFHPAHGLSNFKYTPKTLYQHVHSKKQRQRQRPSNIQTSTTEAVTTMSMQQQLQRMNQCFRLYAVWGSSPSSSSSSKSNYSGKLSPLPSGISPFDKSISKTYDVQGTLRTVATKAIITAIQNKVNKILEIEIPPLLSNGMDMSKNQFDDFDNVQELNANRNWCIQLIPKLIASPSIKQNNMNPAVWLILPDDKECEIAKTEYVEQRYQPTNTIQFTSIRAAYMAVIGAAATATTTNIKYKKAWGSTLAETMNKIQGGDGILADSSTLDPLDGSNTNRIQLICQPGNGGPVEDWINVEQLYYMTSSVSSPPNDSPSKKPIATIIVNGALDKVRDGYYPPIFFPELAKTIPFYKTMSEPVVFLKPITDKGLYGWLYRIYPEPWQVILQLPRTSSSSSSNQQSSASVWNSNDTNNKIIVDDIVVLVSNERPSYIEAANAMIREASTKQQQQQ